MAAARKTRSSARRSEPVHTLSIDIGGTGLKASVLDERGEMVVDRVRVETPVGEHPDVIVDTLVRLVAPLPRYGRCSIGFPGVIRNGVVHTAPNLKNDGWHGFQLVDVMARRLGVPVRAVNDADMQGLAVISGKGLEMVITLGTGFGSALYMNGLLAPHLEIAHVPFRKGETFEQQVGNLARKKVGRKEWNKRVLRAIKVMRTLTNFDHLYVGGGNSKHLDTGLPEDVTIVSNEAGIKGGIALWSGEQPMA